MTVSREVEVLNETGLHARPAAEFVRVVCSSRCEVHVEKNGECYSASSILEILSAQLDCGTRMTIHADGKDAEKIVERLATLLHEFKEKEASGVYI